MIDMGECLLAALLGFISGSFAGVVIYRWPRSESLVYPRSQCDYCRTPLCWLDLLPVVSYVLLRGRCRYCSRPISPLYPGTELLMAVLYAVLVFYCQLSPGFYWGMIWTWGLVVAGIIDWQTGYIPDFISWGGIIISLGKAAWEAYLPEAVAAMLCLGGLLALL